jgi:uncharacterized protein (DUF849 family)
MRVTHMTVWLEAALNGPWTRARQPRIPITVEEIVADGIACAQAGAAIIHLHAYDEAMGKQRDDWQIYARIIEGIRARSDAIVYPTVPLAGSGFAGDAMSARSRYAHIEELAKRGLIEWAVVDPGSVNLALFDDIAKGEPGFVYQNPGDHVLEGLRVCAQYGVRPSYAIYEPGFARLGAALAKAVPKLKTPIYRFMFSDQFAFGFSPADKYLDVHLSLLEEVAPGAPWMIAGLGVDIRPLIPCAIRRGGHVRVGLEDCRLGSETTNVALVEEAVRLIERAGGQAMAAAQIRNV